MDLATNGVIVNGALRFIQSKIEHLNHNNNHNNIRIHTLGIEPESEPTTEAEAEDNFKTTNGVF